MSIKLNHTVVHPHDNAASAAFPAEILGRLRKREITFLADSFHRRINEINTNNAGRGAYFKDPNGHNHEILTRSYSS